MAGLAGCARRCWPSHRSACSARLDTRPFCSSNSRSAPLHRYRHRPVHSNPCRPLFHSFWPPKYNQFVLSRPAEKKRKKKQSVALKLPHSRVQSDHHDIRYGILDTKQPGITVYEKAKENLGDFVRSMQLSDRFEHFVLETDQHLLVRCYAISCSSGQP